MADYQEAFLLYLSSMDLLALRLFSEPYKSINDLVLERPRQFPETHVWE